MVTASTSWISNPPLFALAIAACAASGAQEAAQVAADAWLARVPVAFEHNHTLLHVSVAGSSAFRVVLDTGMPTRGVILYASDRVDALELELSDASPVAGAGGSGQAFATRVAHDVRVGVGELVLDGVDLIVLSRPPGFPGGSDGIIGAELFERFAVRIDVDAKELQLARSGSAPVRERTSIVPLRFENGASFVDARVAVGAGEPTTVDLAIDLGASHALWLNARESGALAPPPASLSTVLGRGLSGPVEGHVGRVRSFELGGYTFEGVVTVFPEAGHRRPGGVDFRDGFVGAEILTRFNVTFDYPAKRMLLEPSRRYRDPFEHDMSGLVLEAAGVERRAITAVLPGSPAAEAGIQPGDALVAVDGAMVRDLGLDGVRRALRRDGVEVRLVIARGSTTIEKHVRLRRLV